MVGCQKLPEAAKPVRAADTNVPAYAFEPKTYSRTQGAAPDTFYDSIWGPEGTTLTFQVVNGDSGAVNMVSHGAVLLSGQGVFSDSEIGLAQSPGITKETSLPAQDNCVMIVLWGQAGHLTLSAYVNVTDRFIHYPDSYPLPPDTVTLDSGYWTILKDSILPISTLETLTAIIPTVHEAESLFGSQGQGTTLGTNSCNFANNQAGDILLVHEDLCPYGWWRHSGMWTGKDRTKPAHATIHSIGSDNGVAYRPAEYWHGNYDQCVVTRVVVWPHSTSLRSTAVQWHANQLGLPYNYNWLWKWYKNKYYCSQLNWGGYYHTTPWYCHVDIDAFPLDTWVAPDEIWLSWRVWPIAFGG